MKRTVPLILTILVFALVSVGLTLRPARGVTTVYNYKNAPGTACRISLCVPTPSPLTSDFVYGALLSTYGSGSTAAQDPSGSTLTCGWECPIVRDDITDVVGTRFAWVDVLISPATPASSSVFATCNVIYSTRYQDGAEFKIEYQAGPPSAVFQSTTVRHQRINLASPWPSVPAATAAHGGSYSDGYNSIHCALSQAGGQVGIVGYGWQEIGGNSADF